MQQQAIASAARRESSRGGRYAGERTLRAMRAIFRMAVSDGLIAKEEDPAARVRLPRRLPSTRRALTADDITASDIAALMEEACEDRIVRRNSRDGTSTREHMLRAVRAIYRQAEVGKGAIDQRGDRLAGLRHIDFRCHFRRGGGGPER